MADSIEILKQLVDDNRRRDEENKKRDKVMLQLFQSLKFLSVAPSRGRELVAELISKIQDFSYEPECGGTFTKWIGRSEDALATHGSRLSDEEEARVLVSKLDTYAAKVKRTCELAQVEQMTKEQHKCLILSLG